VSLADLGYQVADVAAVRDVRGRGRNGGGLISAQSLVAGPPSVLERFVRTVAALPHGRSLAAGFKPTRVVYAILLPKGRQLTPDTLFPFSQATLAHAARILGTVWH